MRTHHPRVFTLSPILNLLQGLVATPHPGTAGKAPAVAVPEGQDYPPRDFRLSGSFVPEDAAGWLCVWRGEPRRGAVPGQWEVRP